MSTTTFPLESVDVDTIAETDAEEERDAVAEAAEDEEVGEFPTPTTALEDKFDAKELELTVPSPDAEMLLELEGSLTLVVVMGPASALVDAGPAAVVEGAPNPGKKLGEYVAVPAYCGHPGTVVLGGARPPPQSRRLQSSPVPGTK